MALPLYFLFLPLLFARGVARVALGLLLGLSAASLARCLFFLLAGDPGSLGSCRLCLAPLLFGLFRVARLLRLGAAGGGRRRARPRAALTRDRRAPGRARNLLRMLLPGLRRRLLAVGKIRFLEAAHL